MPDTWTTYNGTEAITFEASCGVCGWHRTYTAERAMKRGKGRHTCSGASRSWSLSRIPEPAYDDGLYGGSWVLHPVRRVLVWEQRW